MNITEGLRGKATRAGASKKGEEGGEGAQIRKTQEDIELSHKLTVKGTLREVEDPRGESERQMEKGA